MKNHTEMGPAGAAGPFFDEHEIDLLFLAQAQRILYPTAIAGIYGMNFEHMPKLKWRYGYFIVLGLIAVICGTVYWPLRRNSWL